MIASLSLSYVHERRIGAEVALHALNRHLTDRGMTVEALTTDRVTRAKVDGVRVHQYAPRRSDAAVIVNAGLVGRARRWWPRAHLIVWLHNTQLPTLLDVRAADANTTLITNTHVAQTAVSAVLGRDSLVLHPPVPPASPVTGGTAVTMVNLSTDKGADVFWRLAETNPHREFIGVKGGYGLQQIRDLPNVTILNHGHLEDAWPHTAVLLVASRHESYSMAAVEAGWRGIPVLARDLPGVREAVGAGGTYVTTDWQTGLDHVLTHRELLSDAIRCHVACTNTAAELDAVADLVAEHDVAVAA